jgi:hypothetical protein
MMGAEGFVEKVLFYADGRTAAEATQMGLPARKSTAAYNSNGRSFIHGA